MYSHSSSALQSESKEPTQSREWHLVLFVLLLRCIWVESLLVTKEKRTCMKQSDKHLENTAMCRGSSHNPAILANLTCYSLNSRKFSVVSVETPTPQWYLHAKMAQQPANVTLPLLPLLGNQVGENGTELAIAQGKCIISCLLLVVHVIFEIIQKAWLKSHVTETSSDSDFFFSVSCFTPF